MKTWLARKDLMKTYYPSKKIFVVVSIWKTLQILIIDIQRKYQKL